MGTFNAAVVLSTVANGKFGSASAKLAAAAIVQVRSGLGSMLRFFQKSQKMGNFYTKYSFFGNKQIAITLVFKKTLKLVGQKMAKNGQKMAKNWPKICFCPGGLGPML
jgi:hypothetical protein